MIAGSAHAAGATPDFLGTYWATRYYGEASDRGRWRPAAPRDGQGGYARSQAGDQQVRRVWMNVPHTANPKPSWYGESVGHYEGDSLVVDTIGLNDRTFLDNFRTPHTEKLRRRALPAEQ
jgi:hypothetical protein